MNLIFCKFELKNLIVYFFNFSDAHPQSQITRLGWLDNNTLVSAGQDSNIKIWDIAH